MEAILANFDKISLDEMSGIRLMNRIDTKFVTTMPVLRTLLEMAMDDYMAQEIDGQRNMRYNTTYYDTLDYDMYYQHQHGHAGRQKLRFRTYVSSNLQFMEVKTKNNRGRTKKKRMEVTDMGLDDEVKLEFLAKHLRYEPETLTNLQFHNLVTGKKQHIAPLVIVELKRDGLCYSPVLEMLRQLRVFPHGFSKYCMGSALTNHHLQVNRFKPKLIDIKKIAASVQGQ